MPEMSTTHSIFVTATSGYFLLGTAEHSGMMNRVSVSNMVKARNISVETMPGIFKSDLLTSILAEDSLNAAIVLESSFPKSNMQIGWPFLSLRPIQWGYYVQQSTSMRSVRMSGWTYQGFGFFIGVDVHSLVERAELIDLASKKGLLELSMGYGDVALLSIEETPGNRISIEHPKIKGDYFYQLKRHAYRRVASSLIPSITSFSPRPAGLFKRPCASQSLLKELNAESSCVDLLLIGLLAVSLLVLSLLLMLFLLLTEGGGLGGAAGSAFLLDCRLNGNDLGDDDESRFSASAWWLTAVSDDEVSPGP